MALIKFYALCTKSLPATKRHIEFVPKEDLIMVFNSQDSDYVAQAQVWCTDEGIEHYVTTCDGTASTGKNSVFDLFLESDHEYMVLIDGDDFVTPHGVWTYKQMAALSDAPDVVCLYDQLGIYKERGYDPVLRGADFMGDPSFAAADPLDPTCIQGHAKRVFRMDWTWWQAALTGDAIPQIDDESIALSAVHQRWAHHCRNYIDDWEPHLRITFFSRAAAAQGRFDPALLVGEDTVRFLELKDAHMHGQLNVVKHRETYPTYVYDTRIDGVVQWAYDREEGYLRWLTALTDKYDELEAMEMMHEEDLPEITVEWPEDYRPDVCKLVAYPAKHVDW